MSDLILYHNPRCSKSRQALALLQERGLEPVIIRYLENPPSERQLHALLEQLGLSAAEVVRRGEPAYKELGLDKRSTEDQLVAAIASHPILLERPIAVHRGKAVVGRPPEAVLTLLE